MLSEVREMLQEPYLVNAGIGGAGLVIGGLIGWFGRRKGVEVEPVETVAEPMVQSEPSVEAKPVETCWELLREQDGQFVPTGEIFLSSDPHRVVHERARKEGVSFAVNRVER